MPCLGETEQPITSSHVSDSFEAICDNPGGRFRPCGSACQWSESVNDQDQVLVGDRSCQMELSAVKSWPSQAAAKRDSTQEMPQLDGRISTQVQLDAEAGSSNMTDACTVQGQTSQPCASLSTSLSDSLLPAQRWDNETAALLPEQCMASLVHAGKAPLQWQCSQIQGSHHSTAIQQLNEGIVDLASVPVAMSMVGRMMSAATGCFCT